MKLSEIALTGSHTVGRVFALKKVTVNFNKISWSVRITHAGLCWVVKGGGITLQVCCPGILVYLFLWMLSCKFLWGGLIR